MTEEAVKAFQIDRNLREYEIISYETWAALRELASMLTSTKNPNDPELVETVQAV